MQALLLVSHGSRRPESNSEVILLTERIKSQTAGKFEIVRAAFLELAEPSIPEGIQLCIQEGAKSVLVLPYFLAAGRHVAEDIPEIVKQGQVSYPDVNISISEHIGAAALMPDFLTQMALSAMPKEL